MTKKNEPAPAILAEILARLSHLHPKLIDLGLARSFKILDALGNPHRRLPPTIHLAGTNGKGSTAEFLRAMAEAAGLSVHVYSSPHLCRFNERIRLAGRLIDDDMLAALLTEMEAVNAGKPITFFEITTAAAFLAFSRVPADLLILETGLGGELDSTNVLDQPAATILTPIAHDHEHFLGNDLKEIARTKSRIMRRGSPCISAAQQPVVAGAIASVADAIGAPLSIAAQPTNIKPDRSFTLEFADRTLACPPPSLFGPHQIENAALAVSALYHARAQGKIQIDLDAAILGLAKARWPGRVQCLNEGHLVQKLAGDQLWLDGAHNAHGAAALAKSLSQISDKSWTLIVGLLNTRPPEDFFAELKPIIGEVHTIAIPDQPASLSAEQVATAAATITDLIPTPHPSLSAALGAIATDNPVVICGSLYLAGHVLTLNGSLPD